MALDGVVFLTTLSDGPPIAPLGFVREFINIDGVQRIIAAYVVGQCVMGVELLIGQNFTENYVCILKSEIG
mgnify:FL=1